jgi:hypothetical protein
LESTSAIELTVIAYVKGKTGSFEWNADWPGKIELGSGGARLQHVYDAHLNVPLKVKNFQFVPQNGTDTE